jgi:hypothetical protein
MVLFRWRPIAILLSPTAYGLQAVAVIGSLAARWEDLRLYGHYGSANKSLLLRTSLVSPVINEVIIVQEITKPLFYVLFALWSFICVIAVPYYLLDGNFVAAFLAVPVCWAGGALIGWITYYLLNFMVFCIREVTYITLIKNPISSIIWSLLCAGGAINAYSSNGLNIFITYPLFWFFGMLIGFLVTLEK